MSVRDCLNLFFALVGSGFAMFGFAMGLYGYRDAGLAVCLMGVASIATSLLFQFKPGRA